MSTGPYLYVPNENDNTVSVIDISNDAIVATIPVGGTYADTAAISPNGEFVYVASESGQIAVIAAASNSVVATIPISGSPWTVAVSPDGTLVYAPTRAGTVAVIDAATNSVVTNINVGGALYGVAFSPDGTHAYVTNEAGGTVSIIDTSTNSVAATIAVGNSPTMVAISPDGTHAYVNNYGSSTVSVVDTAKHAVVDTINVGENPYGIVFGADGSHAYVATYGGVTIINAATDSVVGTINVGPSVGVAISPDGGRLYVTHLGSSYTVSVIDTSTDLVVDTINVGSTPEYPAIAPAPPAPQLALAVDSGISNSDDVTNVGTVVVTGLLNGATWQYSTDDGTTWINGNGTSFTLNGDGTKNVLVHEINAAEVTSSNSSFTFVLDTMPPMVTEGLKNDTGTLPNDNLTKDPTLVGSGDAKATIHFTVDGSAIAATATADSNGNWSFKPTGLTDGAHTIVASETDAAGNTGTATLTLTLDTTPPIPTITNEVFSQGKVTLTGTTAEANDTVSVYGGSNFLGAVTSDSNDNWKFVTSTASNTVHVFTVTATDLAGNIGQGTNEAILGSTKEDALVGGPGNDIIVGNGGNDTFTGGGGADTLIGGTGSDNFVFKAVSDSTPSSHDTIINFNHSNDVIDFENISGINGSHGVPTFEGKLSGAGNLTLDPHSIGYIEVGGNTEVLVNTTSTAEIVTASDTHAANMEIVLTGVHLGLTKNDFHLL